MSFTRRSGPAPSSLAAALRSRLSAAQRANEQDLLAADKRLVHQRSGRSAGSLDVTPQGPFAGQVRGRYGADFEVARGGDHDFAARARAETGPRMQSRVKDALEAAKRGG